MRVLLVILLSFLCLSLFSYTISAQEKPGITVTPSILRLDLGTDAPEAELYYKNTTNSQIELSFLAQDFSQAEETGRVTFLQDQDAKNYQYSLTSWIAFEKQSIALSPNEEQSIKIFINKDKLTPGGHYASIQAQLAQQEEGGGKVPVKAILLTLLFVRTATGNEREEMSLQSASPVRTLLDFPETFLLRLSNSGNVELVPYGAIEIKDMFGNVVAKGVVNEGSLITLPESVRRFDVPMTELGRFVVPGIYKVQINVHFGKEDKNIQQNISFVSQGSVNLLLAVLLVPVAIFIWKKKRLKTSPTP